MPKVICYSWYMGYKIDYDNDLSRIFQSLAEVCRKENPSDVNNVSKIDFRFDSRTTFLVYRYIEFY